MDKSFGTLPTELLTRILENLEPKDLSNLSKVCKLLYKVSNKQEIWKNLYARYYLSSYLLLSKVSKALLYVIT